MEAIAQYQARQLSDLTWPSLTAPVLPPLYRGVLRSTEFSLQITQMKNRRAGRDCGSTSQRCLWLLFPIAISKYFQVFLVKEEAHVFPWPQRRESTPGGSPAGTGKGLAGLCDCLGSRKQNWLFCRLCPPCPGDETLLSKADNHLSRDL